jgi:AcrR family transcriptional regulator
MPDLDLHGVPKPVAADQRQGLIDALVRVVTEHGYPQTTILKVTEAAGVTTKTFHLHFAGLEECFVAAYAQGVDQMMPLVLEACRQQQNWAEGIRSAPSEQLPAMAYFVLLPLVGREAAGELPGREEPHGAPL